MASIIQGYEYDIFISYRQKDNKYDGWVTEFVDNLKRELEATFKEEISVYFDINPHDGLLETHDVDASLKEKLKCLVFIPIISQTYCDPKSFAWQHELAAFNKMAKEILYSMAMPHKPGSKKIIQIEALVPEVKPVGVRKNAKRWVSIGLISILLLSIIFVTKILAGKNKLPNSIMVLPFSTQDSSQTYFAEGITVDVITELAKVKNISTLSWNTSANYTRTSKPLREIAVETGVSYVLTGIIQRDKQNIRVNVALVSPETGKSIWAQSWDQKLQFVFDIQKQIAKDVANELGVKLSSEEHAKLDRYSTRNFEAYDLFLKARAESRKLIISPIYLHRSNQLLEDALEIDPDFPQALTLRANNLIDLAWKEGLDPVEAGTKAKADLNKSLMLDPDYSDTYIVLGILNYFLEWNFKEAKKNLEKGWELSNYGEAPITQCFCGIIEFNMATGDYHNALSLLGKVEKIDPEYPYDQSEKMLIYAILQDTASIHKILSSYSGPGSIRAFLHYELGHYDEALKGLLAENTSDLEITPVLASAYFKSGMVEKSDSIVNQLIGRSDHERNIDIQLAIIFSARREKGKAIKWYKSGYLKHDLGITSTLFNTDLKLIINEPEVQNILKEIGIINDTSGR